MQEYAHEFSLLSVGKCTEALCHYIRDVLQVSN